MSIIHLTDTAQDIVLKMSGKNPGALSVLMSALERGHKIDPQGVMGGVGIILLLDNFGICGSDIWILYKDVCGESLPAMFALVRSVQLGFLDKEALLESIRNCHAAFSIEEMLAKVQDRLPFFSTVEV